MSIEQQVEDAMKLEEATITCGTTKGDIVMHLYRSWSPEGYDRAVELYEKGFYDGSHFFRVVPNFLVQFGISYTSNHELKQLARSTIPDDPQLDPRIPFKKGTISYAGKVPDVLFLTCTMFVLISWIRKWSE